IDSAYLEARAPLISPANARAGLRELEAQISGRYDGYRVNGTLNSGAVGTVFSSVTDKVSSANPTFGLRYAPVAGLAFRASYGPGFLPPTVNQLVASPPVTLAAGALIDPRRGNSPTGVIQNPRGGNAGLHPEKSKSWSAGGVLTPEW